MQKVLTLRVLEKERVYMEKDELKNKWENYWYYYKYHTLAGMFVLVVIVLIVISCANRSGEVELTLVDTTALVVNTEMKEEIYEDFSDKYNIDKSGLLIKTQADYVDDITAERTGAKSITRAIESGEIDGIFVYRGIEMKQEYIGDIENVLPEDLLKELKEYLIGYLCVDENGKTYSSEITAGIVVNEAKRVVEVYGDVEDYVVLQIPENCNNRENVISFIKYLFDI